MANRIDRGSASKGSGSKKGRSRRRGSTGGASRHVRGAARKGGPRRSKGWSGPVKGTKQVRGSNAAPAAKGATPAKEAKEAGTPKRGGRQSRGQSERATPRRTRQGQGTQASPDADQPAPLVTVEEEVQGPVRVEDLKTRADKMVVGERTVIHHAAKYGLVRGMTWTVILSALLFWLPIGGPALAGYVGGRKAGGPLRGIIAVIIPAICMFVLLAALSEGLTMMPSSVSSVTEVDVSSIAGMPASALPIVGSVQASLEAWVSSPPDVVFIMMAFAVIGGALSSLRRREEETVIEKVGIPLGELKERILQEEAEKAGGAPIEPPSRWHPHRVFAAPVAAHDAFNESVEHLVHQVVLYMQQAGMLTGPEGWQGTPVGTRRRRRRAQQISTGEDGPHFEEMVPVAGPGPSLAAMAGAADRPTSAPVAPRATRARGRGRGRGTTATPRHVRDAIVGDEGDWEVVDTSKGRRPVRVVRSPPREDARTTSPMVAARSRPQRAQLPEPVMVVEEEPRGILRRSRSKVVYGDVRSSPDDGREALAPPQVSWEAVAAPHGVTGAGPLEDVSAGPAPRPRRRANFERLPIVGSIMAGVEDGEREEAVVAGSVRGLDEPTIHETFHAGSIAEAAARELAEMARFEDGPDMEPEEALMPSEVRGELEGEAGTGGVIEEALGEAEAPKERKAKDAPRHARRPKAKSTARKVKHPTGALKSRARHHGEEETFDEGNAMVGMVLWEGPEGPEVEEEDLFSPRRLKDEEGTDDGDPPGPEDGPKEGSKAWLEEERIAALVREREDWDRL